MTTARAIQPDVIAVGSTEDDPWAFETVRELRSDPATQDLGIVLFSSVILPPDMDVTPMSGPDAWVFPEATPEEALGVIRQTALAALEGRLEWAHREWSDVDQDRHAVKSIDVRVELGRPVDAELMAEWLYGRRHLVDVRAWDGGSDHARGWRYGRARRFRRPLLVHWEEVGGEGLEVPEQHFTLYARSGRLLLAAAHAVADLAGGWPSIELPELPPATPMQGKRQA